MIRTQERSINVRLRVDFSSQAERRTEEDLYIPLDIQTYSSYLQQEVALAKNNNAGSNSGSQRTFGPFQGFLCLYSADPVEVSLQGGSGLWTFTLREVFLLYTSVSQVLIRNLSQSELASVRIVGA